MLEVRELVKRFGSRAALDKVSFALVPGEFTALLGPNGAGKTTLFQVLTGLFSADEGEVSVVGQSLRHHTVAALRYIGVVFQQPALDLDLTVRRNLHLHRHCLWRRALRCARALVAATSHTRCCQCERQRENLKRNSLYFADRPILT